MTVDREEVELAESEEASDGGADGVGGRAGEPNGDAAHTKGVVDGNGTEASGLTGEAGAEGSDEEDEYEELEDARDEVLDFLDGLLEAMGVDGEADADIIDEVVGYCQARRAVYLIDPPPGWTVKDAVKVSG